MSKAIQQLLGYTTLMPLIEAIKDGIPDVLPKGLMDTTQKVHGNVAMLHRTYGQRKLATMVSYGAPAVEVAMQKLDALPFICCHALNSITFDPSIITLLRSMNSYDMNRGEEYIALQMKHFVTSFKNTRTASVASLIINGKIWMDSSGRMLPSSSGADTNRTIDAGVPSGNQTHLNWDGNGSLISASWATASTNIPLNIRQIKNAGNQLTGYEPKTCLYGIKIPGYMSQNDYVLTFLSRSPAYDKNYLDSGEIPDGLFDIKWVPIWKLFFEDSSGTNQTLTDPDAGIFIPDVSSDWWDLVEGSYPVPTNVNLQTDAMAGLGSLKDTHGMFAFAKVEHNPPSIKMFHGDVWLPFLKNGQAVFQADLT